MFFFVYVIRYLFVCSFFAYLHDLQKILQVFLSRLLHAGNCVLHGTSNKVINKEQITCEKLPLMN